MLLPLLLGQGGGSPQQDLTQATRFDNSGQFFAPTVTRGAVGLTPSLYTNSQTFYDVSVAAGGTSLAPGLTDNTQTFYSATLAATYSLTPSLYSNAGEFYAAKVDQTLSAGLYDNSQSFYAPSVGVGSVSITPGLLTNSQTFYTSVIEVFGGVQQVDSPYYENSNTFYSPKTTYGLKTLDHVESGWVESGWVSWSNFNSSQFFSGAVFEPKGLTADAICTADAIYITADGRKALRADSLAKVDSASITADGFAPCGEVTPVVPVSTGGPGKSRRVYLERDGQILVFAKPALAAAYIEAEKASEVTEVKVKAKRHKPKVKQVQPEAVIQIDVLQVLAEKYALPSVGPLLKNYEYEAVLNLYLQAQIMQEEEDIEILLLAA